MNEEQLKAIKSLEKAFKKCKEANLEFFGMDDCLYTIPSVDLSEHVTDDISANLNTYGYVVKTHGAYTDSGGF